MFVVQEAREAKITLNVPEQYSNITNPIVHDSVGVKQDGVNFMPGREFRWVGSDVKLYGGLQQFSTFSHLRLNWNDTRQFQPILGPLPNTTQGKFELIKSITEEYITNQKLGLHDVSRRNCGQIIMCEETKRISNLKGIDGDGKTSILYSQNHLQEINVIAYIKWLQTKGLYGLKDLKVDGVLVNSTKKW